MKSQEARKDYLKVSIVKGIDIKPSRRASTWLSTMSILCLVLAITIKNYENIMIIMFFIGAAMFVGYVIAYVLEQEDAGLRDEGVVIFHNKGLTINERELDFEEIKKIKIRTGRVQGDEIYSGGIGRIIPKISSGVHNYLDIKGDQINHNLRLRLVWLHSIEALMPWIELCYIHGIKVDERTKEGKTYGLQERSYIEIQKFKESINSAQKKLRNKNR